MDIPFGITKGSTTCGNSLHQSPRARRIAYCSALSKGGTIIQSSRGNGVTMGIEDKR